MGQPWSFPLVRLYKKTINALPAGSLLLAMSCEGDKKKERKSNN